MFLNHRFTAYQMDAIIGPRDQDHDYRNTQLPAPNDLVVYSALDHPILALDQQGPNGYEEYEVGLVLTNRFRYEGLGKGAGALAVQDNSSDGGIRTLLESEAGDAWSFSGLSGPFYELQRFNNLDTRASNWQTLESAVPQSEELGLIVRSEFADTAVPDPYERSLPSNPLTGERDLSGSLSNSTQMVWDVRTGQEVHSRTKRSRSMQERADSRAIRTLGGQCVRCRRGKRKVCLFLARLSPCASDFPSVAAPIIVSPRSAPLAVMIVEKIIHRHQSKLLPTRLVLPRPYPDGCGCP
jgi:hypothetical protein